MLKLQLTRDGAYDDEYLELPATPAEVGEVWFWLDETSTDVASTRIVSAISDVWNIGHTMTTGSSKNVSFCNGNRWCGLLFDARRLKAQEALRMT